MGGNKARKLELLCGQACRRRSRHAGDRRRRAVEPLPHDRGRRRGPGLPVHLVLGAEHAGRPPPRAEGNQLLSTAVRRPAPPHGHEDWDELERAKDELIASSGPRAAGPPASRSGAPRPWEPWASPQAFVELMDQAASAGDRANGHRAHHLERGHPRRAPGRAGGLAGVGPPAPEVIAVAVAPGVAEHPGWAGIVARDCLAALGLGDVAVPGAQSWRPATSVRTTPCRRPRAMPPSSGRRATARWVLDRTYTGKGFAGLLGMAAAGRFGAGDDVVFWHTGGQPAVFATRRLGAPMEPRSTRGRLRRLVASWPDRRGGTAPPCRGRDRDGRERADRLRQADARPQHQGHDGDHDLPRGHEQRELHGVRASRTARRAR